MKISTMVVFLVITAQAVLIPSFSRAESVSPNKDRKEQLEDAYKDFQTDYSRHLLKKYDDLFRRMKTLTVEETAEAIEVLESHQQGKNSEKQISKKVSQLMTDFWASEETQLIMLYALGARIEDGGSYLAYTVLFLTFAPAQIMALTALDNKIRKPGLLLTAGFALFAAEIYTIYRGTKNSEIMGGSYDVLSIKSKIDRQKHILFESLARREFARHMAESSLQ